MTGYKKMPAKSEEQVVEFRKWLTERRPRYNTIESLQDGTVIGTLGAYQWILDNEGSPLSMGFHEIVPAEKGYIGRIGARAFRLRKNGELYSKESKRFEDCAGMTPSVYKALYGVQ